MRYIVFTGRCKICWKRVPPPYREAHARFHKTGGGEPYRNGLNPSGPLGRARRSVRAENLRLSRAHRKHKK